MVNALKKKSENKKKKSFQLFGPFLLSPLAQFTLCFLMGRLWAGERGESGGLLGQFGGSVLPPTQMATGPVCNFF